MEKYYEQIIEDIKLKIEKNLVEEAYQICKEELEVSYIPSDVEEILKDLESDCIFQLSDKKRSKYTQEDIEDLFNKDENHIMIAIDLLKNSNVRNYIDVIENYISNKPHPIIRSYLIELLIDQGISDELKLNYDGLEVSFSPIFLELVEDQDVYQEMKETFKDLLACENPIYLNMCNEILYAEMLYRQPFSIEFEEEEMLVYAILKYVFEANGNSDEFNAFIHQKNLAKYNDYSLLLDRYER